MNHSLTPVVITFSCLLGSCTPMTMGQKKDSIGSASLKPSDSGYDTKWMAKVVDKKPCIETLGSVVASPKECWSWTKRETAEPGLDLSTSRILLGGTDGWLHVVDLANGKTLQRVAVEGNLVSAPIFIDKWAIFGTDAGFAYSVVRDGLAVEWKTELDAGILQAPTVVNDRAYFVTQLGTIYAVSIQTGAVQWFKKRDLPNRIFLRHLSVPVSVSSQLNGSLRELLVVGNPNGKLEYLDPSTGEVVDELQLGTSKEPFGDVATTPVVGRGLLFAAGFNSGLVAVDASTRIRKWDLKERGISQLALEGGILVVAGPKFVYGVDADSGRILWKFSFDRGAPGPISVDAQDVWVGSDTDGMYVLDLFSGAPKQVLGSGLGFAGGAKRLGQSWLALSSAGVLFLFDSNDRVVSGKRVAR